MGVEETLWLHVTTPSAALCPAGSLLGGCHMTLNTTSTDGLSVTRFPLFNVVLVVDVAVPTVKLRCCAASRKLK